MWVKNFMEVNIFLANEAVASVSKTPELNWNAKITFSREIIFRLLAWEDEWPIGILVHWPITAVLPFDITRRKMDITREPS